MPALTPTVHERLARCGTDVYVDGLVGGAVVTVSVAGNQTSLVAQGSALTFPVPPLVAGASVRAAQDDGSGLTPWSPEVIVEDAAVPPSASPRLPASVGYCSQCVLVDGLVPGSHVQLFVGNQLVGEGVGGLNGSQCVGCDLTKARRQEKGVLTAKMLVCGQAGPLSSCPILPEPSLQAPVLGSPLFGCQQMVPTSNLHKGAQVGYETAGGGYLGSFCSCWSAANVNVGALVTGDKVHARHFWTGAGCASNGPWSAWEPVVPPDERIKPVIQPVLVEGDQLIRVANQYLGASLLVRIRPAAASPPTEFGPRPASSYPEIALNSPLVAGNVVSVAQTLCGVTVESDPVTVLPPPAVIPAPVIVPPLVACGASVRVSSLLPGAFARIYLDGIPIGAAWTGTSTSISIAANPSLASPGKVTARQWVGGVAGPVSVAVAVQAIDVPQRPRILSPVAFGDTEVCVSSVTPGAHISVMSGTNVLGEIDASEPFVRVAVVPVTGPVFASAAICGKTAFGPAVTPITDPCEPGPIGEAGETFLALGSWTVPATADGPTFDMPIEGQLYLPNIMLSTVFGVFAPMPLVVIMHGFWDSGVKSYLGYDYLARHLASWGMIVFSVNADVVNDHTTWPTPCLYSRGEVVLETIHRLAQRLTFFNLSLVDLNRIGIVGHSMGGEGVVAAQVLNRERGGKLGIRAVVSIAPTHHRDELVLRGAKYLQLIGSLDLLLSGGDVTGPVAHFSGFRIYDHAWRPKTHFYIEKARHNPFNRVWLADGDHFESGEANIALPPENHERIAKCLINAFFQDGLFDRSEYRGYAQGLILPPALREFNIHTQFSSDQHRTLIDNFGDQDEQIPVADEPPDSTTNRLGQVAATSGAGVSIYQALNLTALPCSPHETDGLRIAWTQPTVSYSTGLGGLGSVPTRWISLRAAEVTGSTLNPAGEPADAFALLDDGSQQAIVRLGAVAQIPAPISNLCAMRTLRLPLDAFTAANPSINLSALTTLTFICNGSATADLIIDDIEVSE